MVRANARVFVLANANITATAAAACLIRHEAAIRAIAERDPGPYVISVSRDRLRRCTLNVG